MQGARNSSETTKENKQTSSQVTGVNQLWQIDIKYGYVIGRQRFFFVLSIIDVFDRVVVGQYRGPCVRPSTSCRHYAVRCKNA